MYAMLLGDRTPSLDGVAALPVGVDALPVGVDALVGVGGLI